ncbi:Putative pre-16S rRNA nuclease [Serratia symbiotica]|nr:Putative pre-16S rRNA nuclease [Serratia symbiotica]
MNTRTVIAFDFGRKSIGAAIGQELIGTASALTSFKAQTGSPDWQKIAKLLKEWLPDLVVVGLPLNMDGSEQRVTEQARKFANHLHGRLGVQIVLHDERLSTIEARANLFHRSGFSALSKGRVDAASAVVILESWFERQQGESHLHSRYFAKSISDDLLF